MVAVVAMAGAGCGDDEGSGSTAQTLEEISGPDLSPGDPPPPVTDADRGRIAAVINETREAIGSKDYATICDNLAADGALVLYIAEESDPPSEADTCEGVMEDFLGDLSPGELRQFVGKGPYRAAYVDVDRSDDPGFNDSTDTVPEGGEQEIQVSSLEGDGNAYFAIHQSDGSWELGLPYPSGR